jgi:hypothetical protein
MPIVSAYSRSNLKELRKQLARLEPVWDAKRDPKAKMDKADEYWAERRDALGPLYEEIQYRSLLIIPKV